MSCVFFFLIIFGIRWKKTVTVNRGKNFIRTGNFGKHAHCKEFV